jgi:hypothetical protein
MLQKKTKVTVQNAPKLLIYKQSYKVTEKNVGSAGKLGSLLFLDFQILQLSI